MLVQQFRFYRKNDDEIFLKPKDKNKVETKKGIN